MVGAAVTVLAGGTAEWRPRSALMGSGLLLSRGVRQTQRLEVREDPLVKGENRKAWEDPGEVQGRRQMNRIEGAYGLDREGLSGADADVRGDLQQVPIGCGFPKLTAKGAKLSASRRSPAFGPGDHFLRLQNRQRGT